MGVSFSDFIGGLFGNPAMLSAVLLAAGVMIVNGGTDAPNAIATCVANRSLPPGAAVFMAAVFNFLGVCVMTALNASVAVTILKIADFGDDSVRALIALAAGMLAIVIWAGAAWFFGIPTSESHALIAGLSGAAIAMRGGFSGINGAQWVKVVCGLVISIVLGAVFGYLSARSVEALCARADRRRSRLFFQKAQIFGAAAMAFMHGAQDGQKFLGIFMLGIYLSRGDPAPQKLAVPVWLMLLCSALMALGTLAGGYRIIKKIGMDMAAREKYRGFCADAAAAGVLLGASVFGIPVSTTHMKTAAIMGAGASRRLKAVNWGVAKEMVWAWLLTFPGCGAIAYIAVRLFLAVF